MGLYLLGRHISFQPNIPNLTPSSTYSGSSYSGSIYEPYVYFPDSICSRFLWFTIIEFNLIKSLQQQNSGLHENAPNLTYLCADILAFGTLPGSLEDQHHGNLESQRLCATVLSKSHLD